MLLIKNEHRTLIWGEGRDYHTSIFSLPLTFFPNLFFQKETRQQIEMN